MDTPDLLIQKLNQVFDALDFLPSEKEEMLKSLLGGAVQLALSKVVQEDTSRESIKGAIESTQNPDISIVERILKEHLTQDMQEEFSIELREILSDYVEKVILPVANTSQTETVSRIWKTS